jgi:hypothetical protein
MINRNCSVDIPQYDIKHSNTEKDYFFEWQVGHVQPKEICKSKTGIFVRVEKTVTIDVKLSCDELPNPIEKTYEIQPSPEAFEFDLNDLRSGRKDFMALVDDKIMNGYLGRYYEKFMKKFNHSESELLPK